MEVELFSILVPFVLSLSTPTNFSSPKNFHLYQARFLNLGLSWHPSSSFKGYQFGVAGITNHQATECLFYTLPSLGVTNGALLFPNALCAFTIVLMLGLEPWKKDVSDDEHVYYTSTNMFSSQENISLTHHFWNYDLATNGFRNGFRALLVAGFRGIP